MLSLAKIKTYIRNNYFKEQERLLHWLPVGMILGISAYFSLKTEPETISTLLIVAIGILAIFLKNQANWRFLIFQIIGFSIGFALIFFKVHQLSTSMLENNLDDIEVTGTISAITKNAYKDAETLRLVLSNVSVANEPINSNIRLNISTEQAAELDINDVITIKANLYQIPMPCSLHGYFARRAAYLNNIAGTAKFLELIEITPAKDPIFAKTRQNVTINILKNMQKPYGAIGTALVTGECSYIPRQLRQQFADAGLAHVLAISGLHLSLIAGLVFLLIRRSLCIYQPFAIRYPIKKLAAFITVIVCWFYMALANFGIPIQRSFIMITLAMFAICINRTAFSMRSLVIACFIVLLLTPESVISASFQLSFAAVLGLLAFYESCWQNIHDKLFQKSGNFLILKKIILNIAGIFATTLIASLATTPFSIASFQRFSLVAILANLLAIPLVGMFVMPLALICTISLSFDGWSLAFSCWQLSLQILCAIATWTASLPGAAILTKAVPSSALIIFAYGMLWFCLWKKSWRWFGILPMVIGFFMWRVHEMPIAYVDERVSTIAIHDENRVYILGNTNNDFAINIWLQEWGNNSKQNIDSGYLWLEKYKTILISNPKEGIEYILDNNHNIDTVLTVGYENTLKKYEIQPKLIIDRNIIKHHKGLALFAKSPRVVYLDQYFGNRPWCQQS